MIYTDRGFYFIVRCTERDMREFNARNHCNLPLDNVSFGFTKLGHELLRVIPNAIRKGNMAWMRLRDEALDFGQKEQKQ